MNWGYKLLIIIIIMIGLILAMVFVAYRQTNELLDSNYYNKEMNYQSVIDASKNLSKYSNENLIFQDTSEIKIIIPKVLMANFKNGTLEFLKLDDQSKDLNMPFTPNKNGEFLIKNSIFNSGLYKVRISWTSNRGKFYKEQTLRIKI